MEFPSKKDIASNTLGKVLLASYIVIGIAMLIVFLHPTTIASLGFIVVGGIIYSLT